MINILFFTEQTSGFIHGSKYETGSGSDLNFYLAQRGFPNLEDLKGVNQLCVPSLRTTSLNIDQLLKIYRFFSKLGLVPSLPFDEHTLRATETHELEATLQNTINEVVSSPETLQAIAHLSADATSSQLFKSTLTPSALNTLVGYSTPVRELDPLQAIIAQSASVATSSPYFRSGLTPISDYSPVGYTNAVPAQQRFLNFAQPTGYLQQGTQGSQVYSRFYVK